MRKVQNCVPSIRHFLHLPYGILLAPEVYHKTILMIFEHLPNVETMMDDTIVQGSNQQKHDARLRLILELARQSNLKLNREKCVFAVKSLTFVGDVLSEEGVRPDPRKISAIVNMEWPQNKEEVRRFLGMVTYLTKFTPQLSTHSAPLRCHLEQKNEWLWSHKQEACFQIMKRIITEEPVLRYYDPHMSTRISADAYDMAKVLCCCSNMVRVGSQ